MYRLMLLVVSISFIASGFAYAEEPGACSSFGELDADTSGFINKSEAKIAGINSATFITYDDNSDNLWGEADWGDYHASEC